jgi:UDP-hydrolysing UDP-N-acetyl-D-glucosamine 2-epimerase
MRLAVLTTGRQDWGILRSTCIALRDDVVVLAGGMHLEPRFGNTVQAIVDDGFTPERLRWAEDDDVHRQAARALHLVGETLVFLKPHALVLVGDRFETASAALAATVARVPIVHLHGGEETEGAFDNALRHAITKLADLHLVSHEQHAQRVIAMGEDPASVHVVGAPGLDNLRRDDLATREELEQFLGIPLASPVVIVTMHPATLGDPVADADAMLAAMDRVDATYVITLPNTDPGAAAIRAKLVEASRKAKRCAAEALGERRYFGLLRIADAMLGNSSSGIIEAPIVRLPVVNIGDRQKGRLRGANVIDVPASAEAVVDALRCVLDPAFRAALPENGPFGDGRAAARIADIMKQWMSR